MIPIRALSFIHLLPVAIGFSIDARYSAFSDLVTTAYIGSRGTRIRVSLGFSGDFSNSSFFYDGRTDCPAFVGVCYNPELSASSFSVGHCPLAQKVPNWEGCFELADLVALGSVSYHVHRFRLLSQAVLSGPQFREVAGMISLHRRSRLLRGKRLQVFSRYSSGHPGIRIVSLLDEEPESSVPTVKEYDSNWVFEASIPGVETEGVVTIELDPSNQKMVIPVDIAHGIDWLEVTPQGEVYMDCDATTGLHLLLQSKHLIVIPAGQLVNPGRISPDGGHRCEARVLVSNLIARIVIGRQLIESVDHIVLDNQSDRIGFGLYQPSLPPPGFRFVDPKPFIPIVGPGIDISYEQDGHELHANFFRNGSGRGLFLWKEVPQQYRYLNLDVEIVWLLHTDGEASDGPVDAVVYPIEGHWRVQSYPSVVNEGIRLKFLSDAASLNNLVWRFTKRGARLTMYSVDLPDISTFPLEELNLPHPLIAEGQMDNCAVCLGEIRFGETVQNMPECTHAFHLECIKPWLEGRSQTCPSCRSVVSGL